MTQNKERASILNSLYECSSLKRVLSASVYQIAFDVLLKLPFDEVDVIFVQDFRLLEVRLQIFHVVDLLQLIKLHAFEVLQDDLLLRCNALIDSLD